MVPTLETEIQTPHWAKVMGEESEGPTAGKTRSGRAPARRVTCPLSLGGPVSVPLCGKWVSERHSKLLLTAAAPRLEGERGAYVGLGSDPGPTRASLGKSPHFPEAKAGGGPNRASRPRDLRRLERLTLPSLLPGPAQPAAASTLSKEDKLPF